MFPPTNPINPWKLLRIFLAWGVCRFVLQSLKLTYHLKIGHPKRKLLFQPSFFRYYVSFKEGLFKPFIPRRCKWRKENTFNNGLPLLRWNNHLPEPTPPLEQSPRSLKIGLGFRGNKNDKKSHPQPSHLFSYHPKKHQQTFCIKKCSVFFCLVVCKSAMENSSGCFHTTPSRPDVAPSVSLKTVSK